MELPDSNEQKVDGARVESIKKVIPRSTSTRSAMLTGKPDTFGGAGSGRRPGKSSSTRPASTVSLAWTPGGSSTRR